MKKIIGTAIGVGMLLASVSPTFAANICGNGTTGPFSNNVCNRLLNKTNNLSLYNRGLILHSATFGSNSGGNAADFNTTGGSVDTDGASTEVMSMADLNFTDAIISQTDPATDDQGVNEITGPYSNNQVNLTTNKVLTVGVNNAGFVFHRVNAMANSGDNSASFNTTGGSVVTGGASTGGTVMTSLNSTFLNISQ